MHFMFSHRGAHMQVDAMNAAYTPGGRRGGKESKTKRAMQGYNGVEVRYLPCSLQSRSPTPSTSACSELVRYIHAQNAKSTRVYSVLPHLQNPSPQEPMALAFRAPFFYGG